MANLGEVEKYTTEVEGLTQADGAQEIVLSHWRAPVTQVSFAYANTTDDLGTLAFHVKYHPKANDEVLLDAAGAARTVTLSAADLQSFTIENNWVHSVTVTPTSVTGTYSIYFYQDSLAGNREATYK